MWSGDQGLNDQEYVDPEVVIKLLQEEQENN